MFFVAQSCSSDGPQEIPSDKLKSLLIDIAFMDSYAKLEMSDIRKDSVSLYEETLKKHGYTTEDIAYTLETLARRKSNVVVVLLKDALEILEESKKEAKYRAELNAAWVSKAHTLFTDTLYHKDEISYLSDIDSIDNFIIKVPFLELGTYSISYRYVIDSTDENTLRYMRYTKRDSSTDKVNEQRSIWMTTKVGEYKKISHDVVVDRQDKRSNSIVFELAYFGGQVERLKKPGMEIDSVLLLYKHPDIKVARMYLERKTGIEELKQLIESIKLEIDEKSFSTLRDKWGQIDTLSTYNN